MNDRNYKALEVREREVRLAFRQNIRAVELPAKFVLELMEAARYSLGLQDSLDRMASQHRHLKERCASLEEALRFYADLSNWDLGPADLDPRVPPDEYSSFVDIDNGEIARAALSDTREEE